MSYVQKTFYKRLEPAYQNENLTKILVVVDFYKVNDYNILHQHDRGARSISSFLRITGWEKVKGGFAEISQSCLKGCGVGLQEKILQTVIPNGVECCRGIVTMLLYETMVFPWFFYF